MIRSTVDTFDYNNLRIGVDGRWRFLPKTALVLETDLDFRSYFEGTSPNALLLAHHGRPGGPGVAEDRGDGQGGLGPQLRRGRAAAR